jgi:DNA polymerase
MMEPRRLRYLQAMGVDVYVRRGLRTTLTASGPTGAPPPAAEIAPPAASAASPTVAGSPTAADAVGQLDWPALEARVRACTRCALHASRTHTVFGVGDRTAQLLIIGEAPGRDEDLRGEPFVGRAGKLLDAMLRAIGLDRERVYIANVLKCRPPNNRDPQPEEAQACRGYLERQIALIQPRLVLSVGRISAQNLLQTDTPVGRLRGQIHTLQPPGIPLIVTYHPAYLLRSPRDKAKAWADLQLALSVLETEGNGSAGRRSLAR